MTELNDLIVSASTNLRAALERMTRNRCGVLFVCDNDAHVVGALSDGDVRRALLEDALLISPVERLMNTDPILSSSIEDAGQIVRKMSLVAVPVVDAEGRIQAAVIDERDELVVVRKAERPDRAETGSKPGIVAVIPARGGSKRIPKKNLAWVGGKTLLARAIETARKATSVTDIIVSTDDDEIANAARREGVDVPWLRPKHLAMDDTPSVDVIVHAIAWAVDHLDRQPGFGVLLEPTAPLRTPEHIEAAITRLASSDADCVVSVSEVPHVLNPDELLVCDDGRLRPYVDTQSMDGRRFRGRQRSVYVQNGLVYAFRTTSLLSRHSLYGRKTVPLITPWDAFLDIDTVEDLRAANLKIEWQAKGAGREMSYAGNDAD